LNRVEEQQLIQQVQKGSSEAFATLYRDNVQQIHRYIYYRTRDDHLAEDMTADVFTKAIEGLPRYVDKGKPFIAWLYRIAHARVVDHYRRQDRRPTATNVEEANLSVTPDMDANLVKQHASDVLLTAIQSLTVDQQQVIILRFIEGLSIEAVADQLGKKGNAIKALQFRAVRSLASYLERSGFDAESIMAGLF
jgi:RNA polymerase sigma-70 factor (ECF subfamily)